MITDVINKLIAGGHKVKQISKNRLVVYTKEARAALLAKLAFEMGGHYDPEPKSFSSAGFVDLGTVQIIAKPEGFVRGGVGNEELLVKGVLEHTKIVGSLDVNFLSQNKSHHVNAVVDCKQVGSDTAGRKKADVHLIRKDGTYAAISIKQDNAEYWESADRYWGKKASATVTEAVNKGYAMLSHDKYVYKITPSLAVKATHEETLDVVFGSDIRETAGAVIKRSFKNLDFYRAPATSKLFVTVTDIVSEIADLNHTNNVWFLIRNDSTRKSVPIYNGLRVLAAYESRINPKVKRL